MDNIKKFEDLKKLNIKEISKTTHIEEKTIEQLLNKDFKNLLDFNVNGFLKILERDFGLDLSDIKNEFDEFKSQNVSKKTTIIKQMAKKQSSNTTNIPIKKSRIIFPFLLLLLLFILIFFKTDIFNFIKNNENNAVYSNATSVDKIKTDLESIGINVPKFDENNTLIESNQSEGENNESINALEKSILVEKEHNASLENNASAKTENNASMPNTAIISSKNKIWIGIIDIKTGKKTMQIADEPYKIDLSKDSLLMTGHGEFELKTDDKVQEFNNKNSMKFLIENGKISQIDMETFQKYNGGKVW